MAVRDILIWPDPRLKQVSSPITEFDTKELRDLIKDLEDTIETEPGAGLSACQIGVSKRVFIVDIPPEHNAGNGTKGKEAFFNPEIIHKEGSFTWDEGCLSIPEFRGKVRRFQKIILRYQDIKGQFHERVAFDYLSGCFQHELDHLNGILWIDYQSSLKRNFIKRKMMKYIQQN